MKPSRPESELPQLEMYRTRLETFLKPNHPLLVIGKKVDWSWFEGRYAGHFGEGGGPYALPVRLVVGLTYLKHAESLSDEELIEKWVENPYWQHFCGFEYFQHKAPCDPSNLTRFRQRLGEEGMQQMLQETLRIATSEGALKHQQLREVIVDTTAQEKAIAFPTDAKLVHKAREKLVGQAQRDSIVLRQSYKRVSKHRLHKYARYSHAKQFNRARRVLKSMRTLLGRVMRDVRRKVQTSGAPMSEAMKTQLSLASRVHEQTGNRSAKNKVYSLHEPHVACIAKGKAHKPYEFGSKVSILTTAEGAWVLGVKNFAGNPYDGSTLKAAIADAEGSTGVKVQTAYVDRGYRGAVHFPDHVTVIIAGRKRLSRRQHRLLKRRNAIEPVIGHMKQDHRLGRNFLKGTAGDAANALLAGVGFNFRKLLRWLRRLFVFVQLALIGWWLASRLRHSEFAVAR